jgi:site-specific recombinase XerC
VFTSEVGNRLDDRNINRWLAKVVQDAKVKRRQFYDLRYSAATRTLARSRSLYPNAITPANPSFAVSLGSR